MSQVLGQSRSQVLARYPHLAPGLCGQLECPRLCVRACHCPAGQRRARRLLAERSAKRLGATATKRQLEVCARIKEEGQCPLICEKVGGCFLPTGHEHRSEVKRKIFRAQRAMDCLISYRRFGYYE